MKRTAYDILGVPPGASAEEIAAAHARQQAKLDPTLPENRGNPDVEFQLKLLQEAYSLVNEPARRATYDASLRRPVPYYPDPAPRAVEIGRQRMVWLGIAFLAMVGAGIFYLYENKKQEFALERERILAAEQEVARRQAESEAGGNDDEAWRQRQQEQRVRYEMEAARAEGQRVGRNLQYAEEAARRQAEWERQREEQQARMEQARAERDAAMRRYQGQREYRPRLPESGGGVAVVPHADRPVIDGER